MSDFNIPWKFLDLSNDPKITTIAPPKPQKTFAQALNNLCDIPLSQFPQPVVKGDRLAIEIPESIYEAGLEACKHNLHGRILWPKGSTPLSVVALKTKLSQVWKDLSRWGVISHGKGFFEFTFSTLEDVRRVRSVPSWNLNPGLLKLFAWTKDFNPKLQHNTSAQVWVKIYGLSQEYWHKNILFTIAGSLGTPICIDSVTAKPMHERTFGQFARVLVDIDLLQPLRYKLLVERKGYAFFVELEYEYIPEFCHGCNVIGHSFDQCKRRNKEEDIPKERDIIMKRKVPNAPKQVYVPVTNDRVQKTIPANMPVVENNENNSRDNVVVNVEESSKSPHVEQDHVNSGGKEIIVAQLENQQTEPVLTPLSPRTIQLQQDAILENELNNSLDSAEGDFSDSSSQGSLVRDSQCDDDIAVTSMPNLARQDTSFTSEPIVGASCGPIIHNQPPDRVRQDMAFLKESWANLAEAEEEELNAASANDHMESSHDDGFQIHLTKNQKKAQKKLKYTSKDSYATRSKVAPKPFR
ncbi:hypothetical protein P8452_48286 [Trifolium repens]|nr:hypothetical protein P8452_48286 [Trifolium repens]